MCTSPLAALPHVKTGRIRAIAMTGARRSRAAPDVPTVTEQGYKGYQSTLWYGLLGPASMPDPIVKRLNGEINRVLKLPDIVEQLAQQGAEPVGGSSQETLTFVQSEIARWGSLISATKMKVQ